METLNRHKQPAMQQLLKNYKSQQIKFLPFDQPWQRSRWIYLYVISSQAKLFWLCSMGDNPFFSAATFNKD